MNLSLVIISQGLQNSANYFANRLNELAEDIMKIEALPDDEHAETMYHHHKRVSQERGIEDGTADLFIGTLFGGAAIAGIKALSPYAKKLIVELAERGKSKTAGAGQAGSKDVSHGFSLRDINPLGGDRNCVECTIAVDEMLARKAFKSAPITMEKQISYLAKRLGKKMINWLNRDQDQVAEMMKRSGPGSRGVVHSSFKKNDGSTGYHVFNVVNQKGTVRFLDGQSGGAADLSKYKIDKFLRTN